MKNILFGLMAITSVAFAGLPNLGADVSTAPSGAVFQTGQSGEITVTGKLKKNPEIIKYVVFASTDGSYTGGADQEIYTLPDFTITGINGSSTPAVGFGGKDIPKIYVKKVNSANSGIESLTTEVVSFKLNIDPAWTEVTDKIYTQFTSAPTSVNPTPFVFMEKAQLQKIVSNISNSITLAASSNGFIFIRQPNNYNYVPGFVFFKIYGDGTAGIEDDSRNNISRNNSGFYYLNEVETAFATPMSNYSNFSVSVKVN